MKEEKQSSGFPFWCHVGAAAGFGAFFEALSYPFLKIWMEQHKSTVSFNVAYKNIQKKTGFSSGLSTIGAGTMFSSGFYFIGKRFAEYGCDNNPYFDFTKHSALSCMVQGVTAQFFSTVIHEPVMLLTQYRYASDGCDSLGKTIKDIYRQNSVRGIYRAAVPGFVVGCLSDTLGYWFYQKIIKHYPEEMRGKIVPELFAYMAAFSVAMLFTVPFDVIATRLRFSASKNPEMKAIFPEKTVSSVVKKIHQAYGLRGFWRATPANALHAGIAILMLPATERLMM